MPLLQASKHMKKKKAFKNFKRDLYHKVWYKMLSPVRKAQRAGGFRASWGGKIRLFYPVICIVVNDNPEGQLLTLVYHSSMAKFPCRTCWVRGEDFSKPRKGEQARLRTVTDDLHQRQQLTTEKELNGLSRKHHKIHLYDLNIN